MNLPATLLAAALVLTLAVLGWIYIREGRSGLEQALDHGAVVGSGGAVNE
jgi:hypothetical protein